MKFEYKNDEALSKMTPAERDAYAEEKREFEAEATKTQIDEAIAQFKKDNPVPDVTALKNEISELREQVKQLKEEGTPGGNKGHRAILVKEIKEKKAELKAMLKTMNGDEVVVKALVDRSDIADNPHRLLLDGIGQFGRIARGLYNLFPKITVGTGNHNGTINYVDWDEATTVKAAAMVAEGAAFPESTAKWKTETLKLRKVGDTIPVTEEFFEDEEMAAGELDRFLTANVESKVDEQLVNGDNTGENLKGLLASVPELSLVGIQIVADANIYDLVNKAMESITKTQGGKYDPNFVAMNKTTINRLVLKKDANDNYQFPPSHPIYSMIVEDNNIANNVMVVGDSRFGSIYEMGGVTLTRGMVGDQFKEDKMTLKARKRLAFLIRGIDQSGFRKVSDIDSALAAMTV